MKRKTIILNSVLAVTAVGLVAFGVTSLGAEGTAAATETETPVSTGSVTQTVSATGNAIAAEDLTLNFASAGTLTEVDVTAGQTVTAGQVLAKVDSTTAANQLKTAQANLSSAQARLQGILRPADRAGRREEPGVGRPGAGRDRHRADLVGQRQGEPRAGHDLAAERGRSRRKQALANAQAVSSTGSSGQQSTLDQARQTLDRRRVPPRGRRHRLDGAAAPPRSLMPPRSSQTYKSDQQLCAAVSNSSTYVLPDGR